MKLLFCKECNDIFSLSKDLKTCSCGKSNGKYTDDINAVLSGPCKPIGIANNSFRHAFQLQEEIDNKKIKWDQGTQFEAFIIPDSAKSIKFI